MVIPKVIAKRQKRAAVNLPRVHSELARPASMVQKLATATANHLEVAHHDKRTVIMRSFLMRRGARNFTAGALLALLQ